MVRKLFPTLLLTACCLQASAFAPAKIGTRRLDLAIETPPLPSADTTVESKQNLSDLPPVIQSIADERREFQVNLGKAMDTLRKDLPEILRRSPGKSTRTDSARTNLLL